MKTKRQAVCSIIHYNKVFMGVFVALAVLILAFAAMSFCPVNAYAADDSQAMYRLYNPNSGEHFYTASSSESDSLKKAGWNYEGIAWWAPVTSNSPVYRMYNPNAGDHHYTTSSEERDHLISVGWNYEGIGWYSDDNKTYAIFRLYNPNAVTGTHHYTASTTERDHLDSIGWNYEDIGWYATAHVHSYTIPIYEQQWVSNIQVVVECYCGATFSNNEELDAHQKPYHLSNDPDLMAAHAGSRHTYVDNSYYENVITGYQCSCGAVQ